ncbi:hypothetical protein S7711_08090 [Stachybotrys chartarum IBT 7711]|uniref:DUF7892 domain-containing protein n=1 Tax=Stachybotrys chartarum (strain CBS 109288 / IBT 7711) TaxID=1280523 RepID=A0A084B243_STACB|nr:hypothetical protein S7711_08090 [Stachybotrys chartarum IBT 7711]
MSYYGSLTRKRGLAEADTPLDKAHLKKARLGFTYQQPVKFQARPQVDRSRQLPPALWHHVLTFLPPETLGGLLSVSMFFNACLLPSSPFPVCVVDERPSILPALGPDAIWQASRRLFWPGMPYPLKGKTELEMWRLVCSKTCQFCGLKESPDAMIPTHGQWQCGPGLEAVSPIYPFFIVSCGRCLTHRTAREMAVFTDPDLPSFLPALNTIHITPQLSVIPEHILPYVSYQCPTYKVFCLQNIANLKVEFKAVKELGTAATDDWLEGLKSRGRDGLADASRWERWHLSGGARRMRKQLLLTSSASAESSPNSLVDLHAAPFGGLPFNLPDGTSFSIANPANGLFAASQSSDTQRTTHVMDSTPEIWSNIKAQGDITSLHPRIGSAALPHACSFNTIPQFLAQFNTEVSGHTQADIQNQNAGATKRVRKKAKAIAKRAKEQAKIQGHYMAAEFRGPNRTRASQLADEIISINWASGRAVTARNCHAFAADVLLYVRTMFYNGAGQNRGDVVAFGTKSNPKSTGYTKTQQLSIADMMWVFDWKIKHFTDRFARKLFRCNGCSKRKLFDLQALLSHCAMKHSTNPKSGSTSSLWTAEWPETGMFLRSNFDTKGMRKTVAGGLISAATYPLKIESSLASSEIPAISFDPFFQAFPVVNRNDPSSSLVEGAVLGDIPTSHNNTPLTKRHATTNNDSVHKASVSISRPGNTYRDRLGFVGEVVRRTWLQISKVDNLPNSVRVYLTLREMAIQYQAIYSEAVDLTMFYDGMLRHPDFSILLEIHELDCKVCEASNNGRRKKFSLLALTNHFNQDHIRMSTESALIWTADMVQLPDARTLVDLCTTAEQSLRGHEYVTNAFSEILENANVNEASYRVADVNVQKHDLYQALGLESRLPRTTAQYLHTSGSDLCPASMKLPKPQYNLAFDCNGLSGSSAHRFTQPGEAISHTYDGRLNFVQNVSGLYNHKSHSHVPHYDLSLLSPNEGEHRERYNESHIQWPQNMQSSSAFSGTRRVGEVGSTPTRHPERLNHVEGQASIPSEGFQTNRPGADEFLRGRRQDDWSRCVQMFRGYEVVEIPNADAGDAIQRVAHHP